MTGRIFSRSEICSSHMSRSIALVSPASSAAALVVGRVPGLLDHRHAVEALDQHAALVVHREVHRADHVVAPARAQPLLGGVEQRRQDLGVVLELEEAEHPPAVAVVGVERVVVLGADAADDPPVAAGEEQLGVAVLEERVEAAGEEDAAARGAAGAPRRRSRVQPVRELDELPQVPPRGDGRDSDDTERHPTCRLRSTSSRRSAATSAPSSCAPPARPTCCPTSAGSSRPRRPVVEMEGAERIMLGSNNYLGLTGDERVIAGARDALERYGTGLTGSRLLNGTIDLHLELERELAEWMGTEEAIVFTTGHQANVGTLGTLLGARRHRDRRLRRPRLDPRRLPALARQAAPVPPRPARQAREDARARRRRRRRRARRRRRRLLDGGRRRRPAARSSSCARRTARG